MASPKHQTGITELLLAFFAGAVVVGFLLNWCHESDEKRLVRQAQLPEGPASALFDFQETYFSDPFVLSGQEVSDSYNLPQVCSITPESRGILPNLDLVRVKGRLNPGESLDACLKRYHIDSKTRHLLLKTLSKALNPKKCRPGERFTISMAQDGQVLALRWEKGPFDEYAVVLGDNGSYHLSKAEITIENRMVKVSGRITGGLFDSFSSYGLNSAVAKQFSEIFSTNMDFNSDIRTGDSFSLIISRYYKDGNCIGTGRILAARYCPLGGSCMDAYYFNGGDGVSGYFGADGTLISNYFLRSPLKVYRVTSRFTSRRFHPILKVYRPHYGVDLAAPIGTPIMAVADGVITFTGWQRGYGRIVVIKHRGGYKTYYGHLSRFAKGIRKGKKVRQKQIIGYVGRSGYATGPHLDYRVWHNGSFVDPFGIRVASPVRLSGGVFDRFMKKYKEFHAYLERQASEGIISVKKEKVDKKPNDFTG